MYFSRTFTACAFAAGLSFAVGCGNSEYKAKGGAKTTNTAATDADDHDHEGHEEEGHKHKGDEHEEHANAGDAKAHSHDGWWCDEHGIPEEECAMCNSKLAGEMKKAGDWCEEHDRPDSQCFVCHPEKADEFAKVYEAKYNKKPPKRTE